MEGKEEVLNTEAILFFLKNTGFFLLTLLVIAGIVLLILIILILLVLFLPFHYKVRLKYEEEVFYLDSRISFFFGLFSATISYGEKLFYKVKLGFFPLLSSLKKKTKKKKEKVEKKGLKEDLTETGEKGKKEEKKGEEKAETLSDIVKIEKTEDKFEKESKVEEKEEDQREDKEEDFFDKIDGFTEKVSKVSEKISLKKKKALSFYGKTGRVKDAVLDFFNSSATVDGMKLLLFQSFRLLTLIFPKKIEGWLRFGTGDVYTEGQYLTYLCLLYGLYEDKLEIIPEWEEKVFETNLLLKGRIRLFTLLWICIKVYFNKDFEQLRNNVDLLKTRLSL